MDTAGNGSGADSTSHADLSHIFRSECFVTRSDRRVESSLRREDVILGDQTITVDKVRMRVKGHLSQRYGERDRVAGEYKRTTDNNELIEVGSLFRERVKGGYTIKAKFSAEAMLGGAYTQTVTGAYLRLAGWIDMMVWIGWLEVDALRMELAGAMFQSYIGYAHAVGIRLVLAARFIDDFQSRTERYEMLIDSGGTYECVGAPGGGMVNEA